VQVLGEVECRVVDPFLGGVGGVRPQQLSASRNRLNPFCQQCFEQLVIGHGTVDNSDRGNRQARVLMRVLSFEISRIQSLQLRHASTRRHFLVPYQYLRSDLVAVGPAVLRTRFEVEDAFNDYSQSNISSIECGW
jgi:hypothetical protein